MLTSILALAILAQQPDDSPALNAAIAETAAVGGGVIALEPRAYSIGAPLDGTVANITLRGVPGATKLIKVGLPAGDGILSVNGGRTYSGWTFDNIEFGGNNRLWVTTKFGHYFTLFLSGSSRVKFLHCRFRDLGGAVLVRNSRDIVFEDCDFLGTTPGVFRPNVQDPPAVRDATLGSGLRCLGQNSNLQVIRCRFRFCAYGFEDATQTFQSTSNLRIEECDFRGDWWDLPGATLRFKADGLDTTSTFYAILKSQAGGLAQAFDAGQVVSFRRGLGGGTGFTRLDEEDVQTSGTPFRLATIGDVIETADGKRARIRSVDSPSAVSVPGWESVDTYDRCDPPARGVAWRLSRYYASITRGGTATDTSVGLYFDPLNPFTGERATWDAKLDLTTLPARALPQAVYSGVHVNAAVRGLLVTDCTFQGSTADQCSFFDLPRGARIDSNRFLYGQDMGVTCTRSYRAVITNNTFLGHGAGAISLGGSANATVRGNTIRDWGIVNFFVGGIDGFGRNLVIEGNTFESQAVDANRSRYAIKLYGGDCTGSVISGLGDSGSTVATLRIEDSRVAPVRNAITVSDVGTIDGSLETTANVLVLEGER